MVREADARGEAARLTTDKLLVLPDEGIARTSSALTLVSSTGRVDATGLEINNRARTLRLDRVRATYKPAK